MEDGPKSDIKSVIKSDIRFDISIKRPTWIGHNTLCISYTPSPLPSPPNFQNFLWSCNGPIGSHKFSSFRNKVLNMRVIYSYALSM